MSKLQFSSNVGAALKGAEHLLVLAPARAFDRRRFPSALDPALHDRVLDLAKDATPGQGVVTSTGGPGPRRVSVGKLPDELSRYNTPTRAGAVRAATAAALGRENKSAVLLVLDDPDHLTACANAVGRTLPLFSLKTGTRADLTVRVAAIDGQGAAVRWTQASKEIVTAAREAARLVDTPPTDMNPARMVQEARKLLRGIDGVRTSAIVGPKLLEAKLGALHAVGRTAVEAPRLFVARYKPKARAAKNHQGQHVALVGKGITYDTGGLNLKGRAGMFGMKADMGGAAAVLGAFRVLATTGVPYELSLLLCLAENAMGPKSFKPDDVLNMHSGKTVEINNTDAEGRLVLGDGVSYAARVLKADTIFDAATLTGAQLIATGYAHAAVMTNAPELESLVVDAGRTSGDLAHQLPFAPELYQPEFASTVADMRNSVKNRMNAQTSCAGQFIYSHLEGTQARWCHVDLAGPAHIQDRGTGFGVALLARALADLAAGGGAPAKKPRSPRR